MKLADIKKLKVPELRSRLELLGLDTKGLKADLVGRLWSGLESGLEEKLEPGEDEGQKDEEEVLVSTTTTTTTTTAAAASRPERTREFSDSGTQTDNLVCPSPPRESLPGGPERDGGEPARPHEGRDPHRGVKGRSFYEFKEEIRYKRTKLANVPPEQDADMRRDEDQLQLNPHDAHLHFEVGPDGRSGGPRFWDRFPLLWSGCRLGHGVSRGRVGFEVRLEKKLTATPGPCDARLGWSVADGSLMLGEDEFSFAYDASGKKVSEGKSEDFGEQYSEGDIIGCFISFLDVTRVSFYKNGRFMGDAFTVDSSRLRRRVLIPHVLCKNCCVKLNLDPEAPSWYLTPRGFSSLATLPGDQRVSSSTSAPDGAEFEMVLMVGLPGSGKTRWARSHMKQHPEKHFTLLGTEELLSCMMTGEQQEVKVQQAAQCLTELIKLASRAPGNFILDQCNSLFSARRHKLQLFGRFRRRVVVVFPAEDQWKNRLAGQQRPEHDTIPDTDLLKLQVSCSLPEQSDLMEELQYVELPQEAALSLLQEYKARAQTLLPPVLKQEKKKHRPRDRRKPYGRSQCGWSWTTASSNTEWNLQPWSQTPGHAQSFNNWS